MSTRVESPRAANWQWALPTPAHLGIVAAIRPFLRTMLRMGAGLLFMQHGLQKLFGLLGGMPGGGTAPLNSLMGVAGVLELVGGGLIVLGLFTRPVAFLLVFEMLSAYAMAHLPQGGWPIQNGGELALLYALIFAFLFGDGAGPVSADAAIERSRRRAIDARGERRVAA